MSYRIQKNISYAHILPVVFLARGGGGGSGGGGGGGGFGGGSGGSASWVLVFIRIAIYIVIAIGGIVAARIQLKKLKAREVTEEKELEAEHEDAAAIKEQARNVFYQFEKAWGNFDLNAIREVTTENYYKRIVLELSILQNEHRANPMHEVRLGNTFIYDVQGENVTIRISASAQDTLMDTATNKKLFYDANPFVEYWRFIKEGGAWKLDLITQETENPSLVENKIATFAEKNGFYFDPDFGWLMLPNKGVLFSRSSFGVSDVNNHVIGYFRNKIVEFYTYIPRPSGANYLIAQAILPMNYKNILVRKKGFWNFAPRGLRRMELESGDFNKKFCLFASPDDQISSLELLTPNFIEKVYELPFDLNIEIVGSFLYLYTKNHGATDYDTMLEVLSWAFDEMKM